VNEYCHEIAFRSMSEETRRSLSSTDKFALQLGSGVIAGFAAAILSHVSIYHKISSLNSQFLGCSQRIPYLAK
jgi:solute carrier family 25 phosphate transporter 3